MSQSDVQKLEIKNNMEKEKGKGKGKGNVAAIDEKSDIKQIEETNSSGIEKSKEEVFCDGGAMTSEVQHIGETSHCVERKARYMYGVPRKWVAATIGQLGDQEIYYIVDALDTETTQNQKFMSNMLGHVALKGYLVDECSMVLEEIELDFKDWYLSKCNDFKKESYDDWWKHVEYDLKKLFRGIVKLFAKLSPDFSHGNVMGGIPILHGNLYHMKYNGYEEYRRDIKSLYHIIKNVLMRVPPEEYGSSDKWYIEWHKLMHLYKGSRLKGFDNFMLDLENSYKQKKQVLWYRPFFWCQKERFYFLEKVYDIFWVEKNLIPKDVRYALDLCFPLDWSWWVDVPDEGPFRRVFEYGQEGESLGRYKKMVDSISFWFDSKYHYNDKTEMPKESKSVEVIEAELNEKLDICSHVFTAICKFIDQAFTESAYRGNGFLSNQCQCLNSLYWNTQLQCQLIFEAVKTFFSNELFCNF